MDNKINKANWQGAIWLGELSKRYFQNKATPKERKAFENWNPEGKIEPELRLFGPDDDTERIWEAISTRIGYYPKNGTEHKSRFWVLKRYAAAAVAIVVLGGLLYLGYNGSSQLRQGPEKHYFASGPEIRKVILKDGSVVSLNKDTRLAIVQDDYNHEKREVWLEEGEAFFEVTKDPQRPFIVHTQTIVTTVKGTSFNIKAYKALDENVLAVRSGKVGVTLNDTIIGDFTKNKRMTFHKSTGKIDKDEYSWEDAAAWTEGRLVLNSAGVSELQLRLKQQFGVEVLVKRSALEGTLLNAAYPKGTTLKTVLDGIALIYSIKYTISENTVTIYK